MGNTKLTYCGRCGSSVCRAFYVRHDGQFLRVGVICAEGHPRLNEKWLQVTANWKHATRLDLEGLDAHYVLLSSGYTAGYLDGHQDANLGRGKMELLEPADEKLVDDWHQGYNLGYRRGFNQAFGDFSDENFMAELRLLYDFQPGKHGDLPAALLADGSKK